MILLVTENSGFPRFDKVARHFKSAAFEVPRKGSALRQGGVTCTESRFKYLD